MKEDNKTLLIIVACILVIVGMSLIHNYAVKKLTRHISKDTESVEWIGCMECIECYAEEGDKE